MSRFFDLNDKEFREAYVEESFVSDVQFEISKLMKVKGVTRAELARRLSVSAPHVTQMLNDEDANLTLRTVARICDALGVKATFATSQNNIENVGIDSISDQVFDATWSTVGLIKMPWIAQSNFEMDCANRDDANVAAGWAERFRKKVAA